MISLFYPPTPLSLSFSLSLYLSIIYISLISLSLSPSLPPSLSLSLSIYIYINSQLPLDDTAIPVEKANQTLESQQTPNILPSRATNGVSVVRISEKIDRVMTAPHCTYVYIMFHNNTKLWKDDINLDAYSFVGDLYLRALSIFDDRIHSTTAASKPPATSNRFDPRKHYPEYYKPEIYRSGRFPFTWWTQ